MCDVPPMRFCFCCEVTLSYSNSHWESVCSPLLRTPSSGAQAAIVAKVDLLSYFLSVVLRNRISFNPHFEFNTGKGKQASKKG